MKIYVGFHHCNPCHSVLHTALLVQLSPFITVANISPDKGTSPMPSSTWTKDYFSCAIFVDYVLNNLFYAITIDLNMIFRSLLFVDTSVCPVSNGYYVRAGDVGQGR